MGRRQEELRNQEQVGVASQAHSLTLTLFRLSLSPSIKFARPNVAVIGEPSFIAMVMNSKPGIYAICFQLLLVHAISNSFHVITVATRRQSLNIN